MFSKVVSKSEEICKIKRCLENKIFKSCIVDQFFLYHFGTYSKLFQLRKRTQPLLCGRLYRSSYSQMFFKIGCFENFGNITRKHLCRSIFLILYFWIQRDIFPDELICRITPLFKDTINHFTTVTKKNTSNFTYF